MPAGMTDQQMDELIKNEDASFDQRANMKEWMLAPIEELPSYKIDEESLDCPELNDNPIYQRLKNRIL
jgi:hypothetical protein